MMNISEVFQMSQPEKKTQGEKVTGNEMHLGSFVFHGEEWQALGKGESLLIQILFFEVIYRVN